ncbi:uncharacterized protein HMPREF1541_05777 [Cyphellophora europaea CBS 101466]|uniref:Uncharacterized protein n=1 Tax=Cyphellophora europaea (strain CBS 101466) TaxID=1220924 RepID=W2RSR2_CYPE1|nr:uncharacterized protein HMPREF1541_05777 [Cyphellophora europaea CBS 101466]ETN39551.1 hypothetical protein HMPREF1541_05777 [Cyphellophora europaea CBS 101466]
MEVLPDLREATPCPGCDTETSSPLSEDNLARLINLIQQRTRILDEFIQEVTNWEDYATLEAEKSEKNKWLSLLEAARDTAKPANASYLRRVESEWRGLPGSHELGSYIRHGRLSNRQISTSAWAHLAWQDYVPPSYRFETSKTVILRLAVMPVSMGSSTDITWHKFPADVPNHLAAHWDLLHMHDGNLISVFLIDDIGPADVVFFGHWLRMAPSVFVSHLWRDLLDTHLDHGVQFVEFPSVRAPYDERIDTRGMVLTSPIPAVKSPAARLDLQKTGFEVKTVLDRAYDPSLAESLLDIDEIRRHADIPGGLSGASIIADALSVCRTYEWPRFCAIRESQLIMRLIHMLALAAAINSIQEVLDANIRVMRHLPTEERIATVRVIDSRASALRVLLNQHHDTIEHLLRDEALQIPSSIIAKMREITSAAIQTAAALHKKLDALALLIRREQETTLTDLQIELTQTQIRESRKAIEQATTVTRLTILAFVYIPTSCVCGIFGMNFVQTPDGFEISTFAITLSIVLTTTVWLAFAHKFTTFAVRVCFYHTRQAFEASEGERRRRVPDACRVLAGVHCIDTRRPVAPLQTHVP